ncbi:SCO family protein [Marinimicrobium alkaliphilum]|uniref:SCO family protein n=1 Tax=Marinimicrobium alkaliphilum TaxID=2202654 RepID=UPI000DBAD0BC|nr:SCO family protein [Marinimicrobium alkaliphilum]
MMMNQYLCAARVLGPLAVGFGLLAAPHFLSAEEPCPHHDHSAMAAAEVSSEDSLYQSGILWQDQFDRTLPVTTLAGQPVLVTMVYTRCATACPVLVEDIKQIHSAFADQGTDAQVLVVSLDHERDDAAHLHAFAERHGANREGWHFVSGSAADIRTWAALLGVRYRRTTEGNYDHSNVIAVLDASGELVFRQEGLAQGPHKAVEALARLPR